MELCELPVSLDELLEEKARNNPDHPFLMGPSGQVTLGQLAERVGQLAQHLVHLGVQPGDRVVVESAQLHEWAVGRTAVVTATGCFAVAEKLGTCEGEGVACAYRAVYTSKGWQARGVDASIHGVELGTG